MPGTTLQRQSGTRVTYRSYGNNEVCSSCHILLLVPIRRSTLWAYAHVHLGFGWCIREWIPEDKEVRHRLALARQGQRKRIGMRLPGAEGQRSMASACACAPRTKETDRHALTRRRRTNETDRHALTRHRRTKEMELAGAHALRKKSRNWYALAR